MMAPPTRRPRGCDVLFRSGGFAKRHPVFLSGRSASL